MPFTVILEDAVGKSHPGLMRGRQISFIHDKALYPGARSKNNINKPVVNQKKCDSNFRIVNKSE